jgi:hypothetical protein
MSCAPSSDGDDCGHKLAGGPGSVRDVRTRWSSLAVLAVLTVPVGCSSVGHEVRIVTTAAPTTSTTTVAATSTTPTTATGSATTASGADATGDRQLVDDLYAGQRAMVEALPSMTTGQWSTGEFDIYDNYLAAHTHPDVIAAYTPEQISTCHAQAKEALRTTPAVARPEQFVEFQPDLATLKAVPGWSLPVNGAELHPKGRLYQVHVQSYEPDTHAVDNEADVHVGIVDGHAYWFYTLGEC